MEKNSQEQQKNSQTPQELHQMANNFYFGINGCPIDKKEAKNLYRKAAKMGHIESKITLGELF